MPLDVVLYGRPGCCLCDEAELMLHELYAEFDFVLRKINIDDDTVLAVKYRCHIPVVTVNGSCRVALRISPERLRRALGKAQQSLLPHHVKS